MPPTVPSPTGSTSSRPRSRRSPRRPPPHCPSWWTIPRVAPASSVGELKSYRIAVDVGITQERSESMSVPPDSQFLMTDLVLQNPNGDLGTAQLLRNGDVLYTWDLGAMNSANEFQPRVSALPFEPSDNIVLSVACEAAGKPSGTGCEIAVLMGGTLVPRPTRADLSHPVSG